MKRESYTAPFWIFLILFLVSVLSNYITATYMLKAERVTLWSWLLLFLLPIVFLTEAIIYWVIRKKIMNPQAVWAHVIFTLLGIMVFPIMRMLSRGLFSHHVQVRTVVFETRTDYLVKLVLYWSALVIGQAFFAAVLVKSFSKKQPPSAENAESVNLLDDVLY